MTDLVWPEKPTNHIVRQPFRLLRPYAWQTLNLVGADESETHMARSCNYCGSLHPEDLLKLIGDGAELELADRKYGYPHKIYVTLKSPEGTKWAKFYTDHFLDEGYSPDARALITTALRDHTGITFVVEDRGEGPELFYKWLLPQPT